MAPDIAKRVGIHKIQFGRENDIKKLIMIGCDKLNIEFDDWHAIYEESRGDYWLTQHLCQTICSINNVLCKSEDHAIIRIALPELRSRVVERLRSAYHEGVKQFCRGRRFRPSNDPYYKLLRAIGQQESSIVDLNELASINADVRGSINNVKQHRLKVLLSEKDECQKLFYYNEGPATFIIEDPAVFYYIKHLDWDTLRNDCGFRTDLKDYEYDIAISYAREDQRLAACIAENLRIMDASVFYDEYYENNYLGKSLSGVFKEIFGEKSRLVICLLDKVYQDKIWTTFEKECYLPRVRDAEVIPILLDNTVFVGIPSDIAGIKFCDMVEDDGWKDAVINKIVFPLIERLG
jgi:hypothetical protein